MSLDLQHRVVRVNRADRLIPIQIEISQGEDPSILGLVAEVDGQSWSGRVSETSSDIPLFQGIDNIFSSSQALMEAFGAFARAAMINQDFKCAILADSEAHLDMLDRYLLKWWVQYRWDHRDARIRNWHALDCALAEPGVRFDREAVSIVLLSDRLGGVVEHGPELLARPGASLRAWRATFPASPRSSVLAYCGL
ncbi:MAG: hypothetical protein KDD53_03335 [Bdellovibrionales bacterium]|nr:hypothetical protein [Bdellovibrionales bacterium]